MKFSTPEDMDKPAASTSDELRELPELESDLTDMLELDSRSVDEMAVTNGDILAGVFERVGELEKRVESLEAENADLREDRDELVDSVQEIGKLLDRADSLKQVSLPEEP